MKVYLATFDLHVIFCFFHGCSVKLEQTKKMFQGKVKGCYAEWLTISFGRQISRKGPECLSDVSSMQNYGWEISGDLS